MSSRLTGRAGGAIRALCVVPRAYTVVSCCARMRDRARGRAQDGTRAYRLAAGRGHGRLDDTSSQHLGWQRNNSASAAYAVLRLCRRCDVFLGHRARPLKSTRWEVPTSAYEQALPEVRLNAATSRHIRRNKLMNALSCLLPTVLTHPTGFTPHGMLAVDAASVRVYRCGVLDALAR